MIDHPDHKLCAFCANHPGEDYENGRLFCRDSACRKKRRDYEKRERLKQGRRR